MPLPRLFANRIISVVLDAARLAETPAPEPPGVSSEIARSLSGRCNKAALPQRYQLFAS
jgi:hypothetical protein